MNSVSAPNYSVWLKAPSRSLILNVRTRMTRPIYLDYAAATPLDERVLEAMEPYFAADFYNPSATYLAAQEVHTAVEAARSRVAALLGARAPEVHFLPGATAANRYALESVMKRYPGKRLLASAVEHTSVLRLLPAYGGREIPVGADGIVSLDALHQLIDDDVVLVSVMYANNEMGAIQPLRDISQALAEVREQRRHRGNPLPLYLHTDASQAANYLDLHVSRLGVDLMVLNGSKVYGPKQTAVLYARAGLDLHVHGGTENVPGVIGCAAALELAQDSRQAETARLKHLQAVFFDLLAEKIPESVVNGSCTHRMPNNVHVTIPGQDNERLLMALDDAGIMAAAGSACLASSEEPSHVLKAMGIPDAAAQASLRFTMGRGTTEADIRRTVDVLAGLVASHSA